MWNPLPLGMGPNYYYFSSLQLQLGALGVAGRLVAAHVREGSVRGHAHAEMAIAALELAWRMRNATLTSLVADVSFFLFRSTRIWIHPNLKVGQNIPKSGILGQKGRLLAEILSFIDLKCQNLHIQSLTTANI